MITDSDFSVMINALYTAQDGMVVFGVFLCGLFGSNDGMLQMSQELALDVFLCLATGMVAKHVEVAPEPHDNVLAGFVVFLAGAYFCTKDWLRVSLLGAWLPYYYHDSDRGKCGAYLVLAFVAALSPYLRGAFWVSIPNSFDIILACSENESSLPVTFLFLCLLTTPWDLSRFLPFPFSLPR